VNYATPSNNVSTAFISKFNPSGTALLYSTYLGGVAISSTLHQQGDYGKAIAVDAAGSLRHGLHVFGGFSDYQRAFQKGNLAAIVELATGFVTKLNPSGTALVYSTFLAAAPGRVDCARDRFRGDAYISAFLLVEFSDDRRALQTVNKSFTANGYNAVITKMNPTGSAPIYSTYLGGAYGWQHAGMFTGQTQLSWIRTECVCGRFSSSGFPVTAGAYQAKNNGSINITVSKLNPTATALIYSTYLGGNTISYCEGWRG